MFEDVVAGMPGANGEVLKETVPKIDPGEEGLPVGLPKTVAFVSVDGVTLFEVPSN